MRVVESQRATGGHRHSPYPHLARTVPMQFFSPSSRCLDLSMVYGGRNVEREPQASAIPHPWYPREPTLQSQGLSLSCCKAHLLLEPLILLAAGAEACIPGGDQEGCYLWSPSSLPKRHLGGLLTPGAESKSQVISSPAFCRCFKYVCAVCLPGHLSGHRFPRIILLGSPLKTHLYRVLQYEF